jgi:hypothetical protein
MDFIEPIIMHPFYLKKQMKDKFSKLFLNHHPGICSLGITQALRLSPRPCTFSPKKATIYTQNFELNSLGLDHSLRPLNKYLNFFPEKSSKQPSFRLTGSSVLM